MSEFPNRVLIAEDDRVTLHLLERTLEDLGFEIVGVEDGNSALEILESDDAPRLAILDIKIPEPNGLEVCMRIRQRSDLPYTYIILLTALTTKDQMVVGLDAGADDYVTKPFDFEELRARLRVGQRVLMLEAKLQLHINSLQKALTEVKTLKKLLPICMYCKSIRDDNAYWRQVEEYLHNETGTDFSHSICPDCMAKLQTDLDVSVKL